MRVLVTGSRGHLGEALMRTLRGSRHTAVGIDRLASPWTDATGDIRDAGFVREQLRGVDAVLHTATLHKPHVATHRRQDFVDTNVTGTLTLLEAAVAAGVRAFIHTSTTSAFGHALEPAPDAPAAWITEDVRPIPKNVYGATKVAAEDLCELVHRDHGLPCLVLRTSRFFPEDDDDAAARDAFDPDNLKLVELLHRRVELADVVDAHLRAIEHAPALGFGRYIVSATTPFYAEDCADLRRDAPAVIEMRVPGTLARLAALGWTLPPSISRVYINDAARQDLGWRPRHDFVSALRAVERDGDWNSPLARLVGAKGYHAGS